MSFRLPFLFLFMIFALSMAAPSPAQAGGWLEFFFPTLKPQGPNPEETLQAPFANPDAVIDDPNPSMGLPDTSTPLNMRHRADSTITEWVQEITSDLMSYNAEDFQQSYKAKKQNMSSAGNAEYVQFLKDRNFLKTLNTGKYDIKSFVLDVPILVNEGAINGRYRWLYQVKVMVTFAAKGLRDYKLAKDDDTITQEMLINIQVGRANGAPNEHGLLVESWSGKVVSQ